MSLPSFKAPSLQFTIRLYLPNGEQSVQLCQGHITIADLKQMILRKKPHCFPDCPTITDIVVRMSFAKLFILDDHETILSVLSHWTLFRESNDPNVIPDFIIFSKADLNDKQKLMESKPAKGEPISIMGQLWRKRKNSTKFKKQFCVVQSFILFSYDSELDYKKDRPARNVYPLGACLYMVSNSSSHCFQIAVENSCPGKTLVLKADDSFEFRLWTKTLETMGYRYAKAQLLRLIVMLEQQFGLDSEGLFRIAGSIPCMQALRMSCEKGVSYLEIPVDEHSICNMIKTIIRQLNPPLLTFNYFDEFMRISTCSKNPITMQQKCVRLRDIFGVLPATHLALSEYIFAFLHRVSQRCSENQMNSLNLGVVFGPIVLRRSEAFINDTCSYSGNQQQDLVAFIIENHEQTFQKYSCLDFLHHKVGELQRDWTVPNLQINCDVVAKHKPWSYTDGLISVRSLSIQDRQEEEEEEEVENDDEEKSISSCRLSKSESDDDDDGLCDEDDAHRDRTINMNFYEQLSALHSEWDERLQELSKSMLDGAQKVQNLQLSNINPVLLENLARCIEVEQDWRQKAERNAMFMINILSRICKQAE